MKRLVTLAALLALAAPTVALAVTQADADAARASAISNKSIADSTYTGASSSNTGAHVSHGALDGYYQAKKNEMSAEDKESCEIVLASANIDLTASDDQMDYGNTAYSNASSEYGTSSMYYMQMNWPLSKIYADSAASHYNDATNDWCSATSYASTAKTKTDNELARLKAIYH